MNDFHCSPRIFCACLPASNLRLDTQKKQQILAVGDLV
jgi:hypothetical protein